MRRSHFLFGTLVSYSCVQSCVCPTEREHNSTRYSTTSARSILLLLSYMLIYLAELDHGNYVVFCRRSTISSTHLIPSTVVTWHYPLRIPNSIFYDPCGKVELFPCLYHEACVLRMSLLYSAFEVRLDGMITSGICRKIIEFLFAFHRHSDPIVSRKRIHTAEGG